MICCKIISVLHEKFRRLRAEHQQSTSLEKLGHSIRLIKGIKEENETFNCLL